jgi:hypothetical protein
VRRTTDVSRVRATPGQGKQQGIQPNPSGSKQRRASHAARDFDVDAACAASGIGVEKSDHLVAGIDELFRLMPEHQLGLLAEIRFGGC